MPFKAGLQKYIQMDEFDHGMMREEEGDDEGWNKTLEEFEESLGRISISGDNTHDNLRLMGAFIAKTRWDLIALYHRESLFRHCQGTWSHT